MKTEILAPCGGRESLEAAVRCGADAVYLGTKDFNARRNADNFENGELAGVVSYCHERGVRVYLTLNTLLSDVELKEAYAFVENAMQSGVDAFIVQDLGLAKMIRERFPTARLHASTQCSVNSPDGFKALEEMGFCRAVLPREMSLDEIREIRKSTDMELEIFVHGALCMCVSGQCYLSSLLGGRSGNRGLCAQPCRLAFSADETKSCDLSLKDLSLISRINDLSAEGVISFKIEGRMKRPEYVAAAVTACKKAVEGRFEESDGEVLRSVFSRSGFTDGYLTGKRQNMFGTRQKEDVVAAQGVLKQLSQLYSKETQSVPADFEFICKSGEPVRLTVKTQRKTVETSAEPPEAALNRAVTKEEIEQRLSKLGGTPYYLNKIDITLDEGLNLPARTLNALRREAVESLGITEVSSFEQKPYEEINPREIRSEPYFTASFSSASQIPEKHPFKRVFLPIWSKDEDFIKTKAGVQLPRGLFSSEERLKKELSHLKEIGVTMALCSNLGAYKTARDLGFEAYGGFGLNVFNSLSARQINSPILSFELTAEQANIINAEDTGVIVYGRLPVMLCRNCPIKNRIGCEKCKKHGVLTDRKGYKFPVKCSSYPCVEILNSVPLVMSDRMHEVHTDFAHFVFTDESRTEVEKIIRMYKNGAQPSGEFTRGLYYRGVK